MKRSILLASLILVGCGSSSPPASTPRGTARTSRALASDVEVEGTLLPPMPVAVTSFGATSDDAHLYVLGGYAGTPHDYSREGQSATLLRLPLDGSGGWEQIDELPHGIQGLPLLRHGSRLCRFGGNRIKNAQGEPVHLESIADAACFDPKARTWTSLPDLPEGRSSHEGAVIGDTVYLVGGWRLAGDPSQGTFARDILALDLSVRQPTWRSIPMPFARRALGVAAVDGRLVIVGGLTENAEVSRRVDVFDPRNGTWTRGPDFPVDAFGVAVRAVGDHVYASARDGIVRRLRPGEESWTKVEALAFPRFFHQLVAAPDGSLVAIGGISGMHTQGRTRHVERVATNGRGDRVASMVFDYPGTAKNRQAIFVDGDYLYLFGGNNSLEQHDFEPENFVAEGHRVHLPSMRWERVADYPVARQTMQTIRVGTLGVAVGGFGHDGKAAVSQPEAYAFDFETQAWKPYGGLPQSRTQFGLAAHDDALWVFGGLNYDPARQGPAAFDHVTSILRASIGDTLTFAPTDITLPGPRRAFAGATLGGKYYVVGGMKENFQLVPECVAFDFGKRAFDALPCPSAPRLSGDLVALDGKLYLAAGSVRGEKDMESNRAIEVFDPARPDAGWTTHVAELPFDTRHTRALAYGNRLLLVSTHMEEARIRIALVSPL